ncbi:MAG: TIGR04282 family arsenosugar biosynthesis glycosyltransferase [Planctomycetes bacterium]|nr:TIGR04282 family arsenosugar biosynthesis glycosyltransferase [Planctomycetota bacterium]
MNHNGDSCVIFFVKYPTAGRVKTRLAEQVGEKEATRIYESFVVDLLATLRNLNVRSIRIFFNPPEAREQFCQWLGEEHFYVQQEGSDLGEKMKNAFRFVFAEGFSKAVVIGSDSPDLPEDFLKQGFKALDDCDAVIGPANDGGYYLIGFSKGGFLSEAFKGVEWGGGDVFERSVGILQEHGRNARFLPRWYDVDTLEDLEALLLRDKGTKFCKSKTFSCLVKDKLGRRV